MKFAGLSLFESQRAPSTDALTGLGNRQRFDEQFKTIWKASAKCGTPFSLLLFDIDLFKDYNAQYGTAAGDECLQRIAMATQSVVRESADFIARTGGEEFAVILPVTDETIASEIAERLRQAVSCLEITHAHSSVSSHVTISIGISTAIPEQAETTPAGMLETADMMLYHAKISGRDRICSMRTFIVEKATHSLAA